MTSHHAAWRDEMTRVLARHAFRTMSAGSGADAIHKARQGSGPMFILLDMEVAGRSGWETLHDLKSSLDTATITVIIVSSTDERKMGVAFGAADWLAKPVAEDRLLIAVRRALRSEGALRVLVVDTIRKRWPARADTLATEGHVPRVARTLQDPQAMASAPCSAEGLDAMAPGDLLLPGRNGFDFLADLRSEAPFRSLPVMVLTVKDLSDREREILEDHGAAVFFKGSGWRPAILAHLRKLMRKGSGLRVLVADDNPVARELVRETLSDYVAAIDEAANGRETLHRIREALTDSALPDLVLMDIQMPEMDGFAVLREIRQDPALRGLRVVALTAFAMQGDRERALEAGFDDYITKPITLAKLKSQLDLLNLRAAAD